MSSELTPQERKRSRWRGKNYENRVAKKIKGVVVGRSKGVKVSGVWISTNCQGPPDVVNTVFSVECKYWAKLPVWLDKVMRQAVKNAPEGLTPVAWVGDREAQSNFVILTEGDFIELLVGDNG